LYFVIIKNTTIGGIFVCKDFKADRRDVVGGAGEASPRGKPVGLPSAFSKALSAPDDVASFII